MPVVSIAPSSKLKTLLKIGVYQVYAQVIITKIIFNNPPAFIKSIVLNFPVLNAIAFGGVEIGRIKAKLQAIAEGIRISSGFIPSFDIANLFRIGKNICAVETFEVNPVVRETPAVAIKTVSAGFVDVKIR